IFLELGLIFFQAVFLQVDLHRFTVIDDRIFFDITVLYHLPEIDRFYFGHIGRKRPKKLEPYQYGENDGIDPINTEPGTFPRRLAGIITRCTIAKPRWPVGLFLRHKSISE